MTGRMKPATPRTEQGRIRIVGGRDDPCRFQPLVVNLAADLEELQHAVRAQLVAKAGEVETRDEVFDVEAGNAKRHGTDSASAWKRQADAQSIMPP